MSHDWHAAVDIGGTFTDLLVVDRASGAFAIEKALTTHSDLAAGVRDGLVAVLGRAGISPNTLRNVVHATTLVTNAVIERRGPRTALLITEGFRDTLLIGREHRYDMYDLLLEKPEPLVRLRDTIAVPERVLADGTIYRPLDRETVEAIAEDLRAREIRAVGVCLLHSYRYPQHELDVRDILLRCWPEFHVTLSHEVAGELREYERASTTVANAYVLELVGRYLDRMQDHLTEMKHGGQLLVMLSSGAIATTEVARKLPVRLIESGPAAGALAAAEAGRRMGCPDLLSFDMGGTTAKACIIQGGRPIIAAHFEVARVERFRQGSGIPLQISSVDLIEIGAGGGSLARLDAFGLLQVGPTSAGSDPGPVCYGLGGMTPTVTDADLLLGYLDPDFFLGGQITLDKEAAKRAIEEKLGAPLGLTAEEAAWVVHEVVNENMGNAARVHAVERGADLQILPLFAFGGAGPVHAYRVAKNLGLRQVICPLGAGVGSTIGLLAAPLAFDFVRTAVAPLTQLDWSLVGSLLAAMEGDGRRQLMESGVSSDDIRVERAADMRLFGQAHEITVDLPGKRLGVGDNELLMDAFEKTYVRLFGRRPPDVSIEVVSWRVRVLGPRPGFPIASVVPDRLNPDDVSALKGSRQAFFPEARGFIHTPVFDRYRLLPESSLEGPAIVEERESTVVIGPEAKAIIDRYLNLIIEVPR